MPSCEPHFKLIINHGDNGAHPQSFLESIYSAALNCLHDKKTGAVLSQTQKKENLKLKFKPCLLFSPLHSWPITAWAEGECRVAGFGKLEKLTDTAPPVPTSERCWGKGVSDQVYWSFNTYTHFLKIQPRIYLVSLDIQFTMIQIKGKAENPHI